MSQVSMEKWKGLLVEEYGAKVSENRQGICVLELNNCLINVEAKEDQVFLYTGIAFLPQKVETPVYEYILEENFLGLGSAGGHIGLHKETRILTYSLIIDTVSLDAYRFRNILELFSRKSVEIVEKYKEVTDEAEKIGDENLLSSIQFGNVIWG